MNIYQKQSLKGFPWNQIKSENISALKEQMQINYKKACNVIEQAWISTLC